MTYNNQQSLVKRLENPPERHDMSIPPEQQRAQLNESEAGEYYIKCAEGDTSKTRRECANMHVYHAEETQASWGFPLLHDHYKTVTDDISCSYDINTPPLDRSMSQVGSLGSRQDIMEPNGPMIADSSEPQPSPSGVVGSQQKLGTGEVLTETGAEEPTNPVLATLEALTPGSDQIASIGDSVIKKGGGTNADGRVVSDSTSVTKNVEGKQKLQTASNKANKKGLPKGEKEIVKPGEQPVLEGTDGTRLTANNVIGKANELMQDKSKNNSLPSRVAPRIEAGDDNAPFLQQNQIAGVLSASTSNVKDSDRVDRKIKDNNENQDKLSLNA